MTDPADYSFEGCRNKLRDATRIVMNAERDYETAIKNAADSESFYRTQLHKAFAERREAGDAVEAASIAARAACAVHSRQRDIDEGMKRLAQERLEDARDARRSVWRLVEWARDRDLATAAKTNGGQAA